VSYLAEEETRKSIYEDDSDRVERTIDTSGDMFDDVFGEDDEKKAAKKRLEEKAKELKEKNNKKPKEVENDEEIGEEVKKKSKKVVKTKEDEDTAEDEDTDEEDLEEDEESDDDSEDEDSEEEDDSEDEDLEDDDVSSDSEDTSSNPPDEIGEPEIFLDKEDVENKKKEVTGKLNLKISVDEEEEEEKQVKRKASPLEKKVIKSVIKNKAEKAVKEEHDDLAEYLLREQGVKEEGVKREDLEKWGFEKEAENIGEEQEREELEKIEEIKGLKPRIDFLVNEETGHAYIGRKKSVLKKYGEEAGLYVGKVGEDEKRGTDIYLDGLNPHVVFVCGARGSGKSYVLGVIAEELALKNKQVGIVVVDPIGVFWSMKHPNKEEKELELLAQWEIMPQGLDNIKVFIPVGMKGAVPKSTYDSTFSIQPALLTAEDWCLTFGIDRFSPTGLLMEKGITRVKKGFSTIDGKTVRGKENTFSLEDLIFCFEKDSELNDRERGYKTDSIRALVSRFDAARSWGIFDEKGTPLSALSRAGQMTILDTSFLEDNVSALVIGILARRLLSARKLSTRREAAGKFSETTIEDLVEVNVPPTWLFIDEAHTLIPGGNQKTPASSALVEYVKQGRRPGLSLVFATQQPSAIDSRVLSQLDVIMAHKLVFDDDVKAIQKRTPAIIPGAYKKSNFIKTLPVGTALTGDRQETTARAFVMNIRPRMSQHEGRDAETVEVVHELSTDQVEKLAVSIVLRQLEKDPSISIASLRQTLESLNDTYKQKVLLETILEAIRAKGIDVDEEEGKIYATGVLAEMEAEKEAEELEAKTEEQKEELAKAEAVSGHTKEELEKGKDEEEELEEKGYEEKVELSALKANVSEQDARKMLAKLRLKKALGLFGEEEIVDRLNMKYGTLYKIKYNYFSQKDAFQIGEAYINSLSGEFIHDRNGALIESNGLPALIDLNEAETNAIKLLNKKRSLEELAKGLEMEKGNAKRVLEKLAEKDLVIAGKQKEEFVYSLKYPLDLPMNPLHAILSSIGKRPIVEVESAAMLPPNLEEKRAIELLKKLWGNVNVKEITHLFLPVWEGVLKKKTGEERVVRIDAINGKEIK